MPAQFPLPRATKVGGHLSKNMITWNTSNKESVLLPVITCIMGIGVGFLIATNKRGNTNSHTASPAQSVSPIARRSFQPESTDEVGNVFGRSFNPTSTQNVHSDGSRQNALSNLVAQAAAEDSAAYGRWFETLGLDKSKAGMIRAELINLHHLAISAGEPLRELKQARQKFDKLVKEILGDEHYSKYRQFEESKPARRELALLRKFAWEQHNTALDPAWEETLIDMIRIAGATTTESWHGPYDPAPRPMVGEEAINHMRSQISDLKKSYSVFREKLISSGIPPAHQGVVLDYYARTIDGLEKNLTFWDRPISEIIAENEKMIEERIKREVGLR